MRSRASLSACLTRHGGHCAKRSSNIFVAWGLSQCSHSETCTFSSRRPKSNATHSPRLHGSQTIALRSRRAFSSTACARVSLDFDDEPETSDEVPQQPRGKLRNSRPTKFSSSHVGGYETSRELNSLLRSRSNVCERQEAPAQKYSQLWTPLTEEVRRIDQKLQSLQSLQSLCTQFLDIKYSPWEYDISQIASVVRDLPRRFLDIKYSPWEDDISQIALDVRHLQRTFDTILLALAIRLQETVQLLTAEIERFAQEIRVVREKIFVRRRRLLSKQVDEMRHTIQTLRDDFSWEYLEPRKSAWDKINAPLGDLRRITAEYNILKKKYFQPVAEGLRHIKELFVELRRYPSFSQEQQGLIGDLFDRTHETYQVFTLNSHNYRLKWTRARRWEHPHLREAEMVLTFKTSRLQLPWMEVLDSIIFGSSPEAAQLLAEFRSFARWNLLNRYGPTRADLKPARSPELDICWRQLDIVAPFILHYRSAWRISLEIYYLIRTFRPTLGMWANVPDTTKRDIKNKFIAWVETFDELRGEFQEEHIELIHIDWYRLNLETRLHNKGLPNDILERGLFVAPNPLSQDPARFKQWVYAHEEIFWDAIVLLRAQNASDNDWAQLFSKWERRDDSVKSQVMMITGPETPNQSTQKDKKLRRRNSGQTVRYSKKKGEPETIKKRVGEATKLQKWTAGHHKSKTKVKRKRLKSPESTTERSTPAPVPLTPKWRPLNNAARLKPFLSRQHKRVYGTDATPCRCKAEDRASHVSISEQSARLGIQSVSFTEIASESPCASRVSALPERVTSETSSSVNDAAAPQFWSHNSYRRPNGQSITVHYCRSIQNTEEVAQHFLESKVLGFDMEWKAQSFSSASIKHNLSLIQVANEERIALFHIALFRPAQTLDDLVAPSLKLLLESPDITKVGVSIKGDSTRLRKYLGIEARSIFELSYLYKLVKYGQANPKLVNKRSVNLSDQVEEHLGLPLEKSDDVRCSDWTRALNYRQVHYAAADAYACLCLFHAMEIKRQAMDPMPPCPAHAELNLPIILPHGQTVNNDDKEPPVPEPDAFKGL